MVDVGLLNNAILPNFGTLIRWRSHSHVLRQSVGWFENDFAGRIANRIMQTPPAAGEAVFQVFDAMTYATAYVIGALILLSDADPALMLPLMAWLVRKRTSARNAAAARRLAMGHPTSVSRAAGRVRTEAALARGVLEHDLRRDRTLPDLKLELGPRRDLRLLGAVAPRPGEAAERDDQ